MHIVVLVSGSILFWCQTQVVKLGPLHLVAAVGSTARQSAAGPTSGCSYSRRSAQASGTDRQNVQCELEQELLRERERQLASQSESMGEQRLPRGQEDILLPRVRELPGKRRSLGAKVAARKRGALSGPGSLPERARIAEVATDAEASETCKRSCVLPEGLARRRRGLSLSVKRLFIAVWITGRGVSESPWIAGRSERARVLLTCRSVERLDTERLQKVCRVLDGAARRRQEATEQGPRDRISEKTLPCRSKQDLLQEKEGGVWQTVTVRCQCVKYKLLAHVNRC